MNISGENVQTPVSRIPDPVEIREELSHVLASPSFRGSKRCQDFLQYVVLTVLEGGAETLKERTLATEVFGRHASDDLGTDSIVRVGAREVRKRLAQFYVGDGAHHPLRIELPSGSYIPSFLYHAEAIEQSPALPAIPESPVEKKLAVPKFRLIGWQLRAATLILAIAAVSLAGWRVAVHVTAPFEVFWRPAFAQKTPINLLIAHPIVYHPSGHASQLDQLRNGTPRLFIQRPIDVPPNLLDGSDFVAVTDQYVGFGDALATIHLANLFFHRGGNVHVRLASKMDFNDMVGAGAVLIGAYTNRWTAELTKDFRFRFAYEGARPCILDSHTGHKWVLSGKSDNGHSSEDYILISRLPHSRIDGFIVIAAGLTVYGTEEAGRILSEPASLDPILQKLPSDWPNRNIELVLHVEVVGDAPALPEVVARHTW